MGKEKATPNENLLRPSCLRLSLKTTKTQFYFSLLILLFQGWYTERLSHMTLDRKRCDTFFLIHMKTLCRFHYAESGIVAGIKRAACLSMASVWYKGVRLGGIGQFNHGVSSQKCASPSILQCLQPLAFPRSTRRGYWRSKIRRGWQWLWG